MVNTRAVTQEEIKSKLPQTFWSKIKFDDTENCWEWQACTNHDGYGWYHPTGKNCRGSHRHIFIELFGQLPTGIIVCHKCNNPKCCNPAHLYAGTNQDNTNDRERAGRGITFVKRGSQFGNAKLNEEKVMAIKQRLATGEMGNNLAKDYGVSIGLISMIKNGRNWTHVQLPK